jgi:hypothetical protein
MLKVKVRVQLTEGALRGFKDIQEHEDLLVSHWGMKYLQGLTELPSKRWLDVRRHWDGGVFKISDLTPFDIRGKVEYGAAPSVIVVCITHFQLKGSYFPKWSERNRENRIPTRSFRLN